MNMATADLQRQCLDLLSQLKTNQAVLRQSIGADSNNSALDNNMNARQSVKKPEYARQKLKSIMKNRDKENTSSSSETRTEGKTHTDTAGTCASQVLAGKSKDAADKESKTDKNGRPKLAQGEKQELSLDDEIKAYFESRTTDSLMEGGTDSFSGPVSSEDNTRPQPSSKPTTPTPVRRRRIIDRNVHVDSKLSDKELLELEKNSRGLNFSYSQNMEIEDAQNKEDQTEEKSEEGKETEGKSGDSELTYQKNLVDRGNNRQLNNFIRDTTIKPKTILNSTYSRSYSKEGPGVSFQSSSNASGNSSLFRSQTKERRLLGYDWIAALVHNETGLMDESESYFQELREFRRSNRDECCNDFYMEGPFTLTESEPPEVEKAIKETKVQPYTVNDRLFTVPVTENLLGEPMDAGAKDNKAKEAEPSQEHPRFVRVSIPRSTLQMPYKVRPHRRRSFDASDSCALMDHCLKGWNAVSPATLPTAASVSLTDAMTGVNPKHTTTLVEAEKAAAMFHWPLVTSNATTTIGQHRLDPLPTWRKQYTDTTANFLPPDSLSLSLASSLAVGEGSRPLARPANVQRKTDELLNSTYAMMYEMQKVRDTRKVEMRRQNGEMAS